MYYTYVINSEVKNYTYIGISDNIARRVSQHNLGYNKTTKPYRPFKLILEEVYSDRAQARKREKFLKSGIGREFLKTLK